MSTIDPRLIKHITYIGLFVIAIGFGVFLFWPFAVVLLLSAALAVVLHPLHEWCLQHITRGNKWFASLITIILFLLLVCVPLFVIGSSVFHQAQSLYQTLSEQTSSTAVFERANTLIERYFPWGDFRLEDKALALADTISARLGDILSVVISTIFSILLIVLALFYFLKDGPRWRKSIMQASPLSDESTHRIVERLAHAINGVVKGYLLVGIIQGVLLGVGLWVFGVPNPALWGLLAGIASLIPTIGTSLVSVPAVIFLFSVGKTGDAVGLAVWAMFLVGMIDNLLNPIIVGRKIDIHPMFILFSVLGGIVLIGPAGILIGPLAVSFIYALTSVYASEMK